MLICCPLKFHVGRPDGFCNPNCALFDASEETCLIALALEHYLGKKENKIQTHHQFPNDNYDNPTSGWETWRISTDQW